MSNKLKTRLEKLEAVSSASNPYESMTDEELYRTIHSVLLKCITDDPENAGYLEEKRKLEDEVRRHVEYEMRPDVAQAIARNRAAGIPQNPWYTDWIGLAKEWQLPCISITDGGYS